jgi:hypothetical protein
MRGHLTYDPETRVAQVQCGKNGCNATSTGVYADERKAAWDFRLMDWRQDARGMWVCGKHPAHQDGGAS